MSHFPAVVILPEGAQELDIVAQIDELLEPFKLQGKLDYWVIGGRWDHMIQGGDSRPVYKEPCSDCGGTGLGGEPVPDPDSLLQTLRQDLFYSRTLRNVSDDELRALIARNGCLKCMGTGAQATNPLLDPRNQTLEDNTSSVAGMHNAQRFAVVVTPNGEWIEGPRYEWYWTGIIDSDFAERFLLQIADLQAEFATHQAVGIDCHW